MTGNKRAAASLLLRPVRCRERDSEVGLAKEGDIKRMTDRQEVRQIKTGIGLKAAEKASANILL